ncbi:glycosyltransferase family 2 protein [Clostridium gasigenes]|uniref:glycosyltransferase family 2 protein n=1 Tax=Clostridium gasigenes TaxID=94869 RepID=UPI001C0DC9EB|nr:glycosyltransferase family 2 protein [Clostridium gasigenes]MBU3134090.1 glycosyltransferase family 2 protein [Clostridium gasigenes]
MELITVIIPTYNRAKTLLRSMNSVLNQTYKNIELIIVDDNSDDGTLELVSSLSDNRVKYIKNSTNKGACYSRNLGVDIAKGEYIAFQDSDDEWDLSKLELQINNLKENNYDIVSCYINQIFEGGTNKVFPSIDIKDLKDLNYKNYILLENIFSTQTILGKRKCFIETKFDNDLPRFQDWDLMIRMCQKYKIGFSDNNLVDAFIQKDSISKNNKKAVIALSLIRKKYANSDELNSFYFRNMAIYSICDDLENARGYFTKAYQYNRHDYKNKFNYVLIKLNLLILIKFIYKAKRKLK